MYCCGAELPPAPIEWLATTCCCGTVRLASVAFWAVMSLPSDCLWPASSPLSAIPFSVRCTCCSTSASWLAWVRSCLVWAFLLPDSSCSRDPCRRMDDGLPEVSTPAIEVAPVSSNAAAAAWATSACAVWNRAVACAQREPHLGQPGTARGQLLAGLVQLLANLVELRRELVDLRLYLRHGGLRCGAGHPAVRGQPGPLTSPAPAAMPRCHLDARASSPFTSLSRSFRSPGWRRHHGRDR